MSTMRSLARRCLPRRWRNWLRAPRRTLQWAVDGAQFALGQRSSVEMRPGWEVVCHPAALRLAYAAHLVDPEQAAELDAFIARCRPGMRLWDIGAHFGLFSLAALHYGGPDAAALAVDPSATAARMLAIQARLNGVAGRVEILQAAVGDQAERQAVLEAGVIAAGYCVAPGPADGPGEWSWVAGATLDGLAAARGGESPTHLKIDVEGGEEAVLRGAQALLAAPDAPVLFLELHHDIVRRRGGNPESALDALARHGYRLRAADGRAMVASEALARGLVRVVATKEPMR
jgi:FkbM family methyltransferase